jgi:DNA polymerase III gamma/tau subunit
MKAAISSCRAWMNWIFPSAANGLRRRLDEQQDSGPLILCGPEGVGKRTLGRLFAKGLLCEGMLKGLSPPCDCCEACRQFETGSLLDFIEFDANAPHTVDYVNLGAGRNRPLADSK